MSQSGETMPGGMGESMGQETPERVTEQAQEKARQAQQGAESLRQSVAGSLHNAAQRLRQQSQQMGERNFMGRVAEPLDRSALYLQSHTLPQIRADLTRTAREHPGWTIAGVFVTAFLVGRMLHRR